MLQEVSDDGDSVDDGRDSLFGEDDTLGEEAGLMSSPPGPASALSALYSTRRPHSSMGGLAASLLETLSIGSAGPAGSPSPGRRQRQRTLSTNAAISTEREPIIRAPKRTIYTQGRPPWYDSQGQQVSIGSDWSLLLQYSSLIGHCYCNTLI